jgi:hypothetical protein
MVELRDEVTWAQVAAVMAEAWVARADRMAQESAILLASAHGEDSDVARKVSLVEGQLAVARQAWDAVKAKLPGLVDKVADTDRRREGAEGQCEELAEELTLMWIGGSELCLTVGYPPCGNAVCCRSVRAWALAQ